MKPARQMSSTPAGDERRGHRRLELRLAGEALVVERLGGDARRARGLEPRRVRLVGQDERDLGRKIRARARPRSARSCWSRGPRSGRPVLTRPVIARAVPASRPAARPTLRAGRSGPAQARRARAPRAPRPRARPRRTTAMPKPQLKVRSISASGHAADGREPGEHRRRREGVEVEGDREPVGQHARQIVRIAAAGDVGERQDAVGLLEDLEQRPDVEPGRRQQRLRRATATARTARARPSRGRRPRRSASRARSRWSGRRTTAVRTRRRRP